MFKLFRALGLRHLVVVDDENRVGVVVVFIFGVKRISSVIPRVQWWRTLDLTSLWFLRWSDW